MAIDFHARRNRSTYTGRQADAGWVEAIRRIVDALQAAGFRDIKGVTLWELRKTHDDWQGLKQDLANRTGRSILHDLSYDELAALILFVEKRLAPDGPIVEKDRWTMWSALA